jgi:hypothetical protein
MIPLLRLAARSVYYVPHTVPAVFYLADLRYLLTGAIVHRYTRFTD